MCHYITLTTDCPDVRSLTAALERHDRNAKPLSNPSIQRLLKDGEHQYVTARSCDCGTVLGHGGVLAASEDLSKVVERKRKSGWSKAKIDRWLADREKSNARPAEPIDSLEVWAKVIADVLELRGTSTVGLIVHLYSGRLDEETFTATRRELRSDSDIVGALAQMQENELLIVSRSPKGPG